MTDHDSTAIIGPIVPNMSSILCGKNSDDFTEASILVSHATMISGATVSHRCDSSAVLFLIVFMFATIILKLSVGLL